MESAQMPISRRMDKESVMYIYSGASFINKEEAMPFAGRCMRLDIIMSIC